VLRLPFGSHFPDGDSTMNSTSSTRTRRFAAVALTGLIGAVGLSACGSSSSSAGAYCDKVKEVQGLESAMDDLDPTNMGESIKTIEKLASTLKGVASAAPSEIKPEWDIMSESMDQMTAALSPFKDIDLTNPESIDPSKLADLQKMSESMDGLGEKVEAAGDKIDTYTEKACGFKIGS
jgi:hypothetical protein